MSKKFFTLTELSAMFGESQQKLRRYVDYFDLAERTVSAQNNDVRIVPEENVDELEKVLKLRDSGMSLKVIKTINESNLTIVKRDTLEDLKKMMIAQQKEIEGLKGAFLEMQEAQKLIEEPKDVEVIEKLKEDMENQQKEKKDMLDKIESLEKEIKESKTTQEEVQELREQIQQAKEQQSKKPFWKFW